jgi:hypothetical protein
MSQLKVDTESIITNGMPHKDTIKKIEDNGFIVLRTLRLHDLQPDYGMNTDYITFYVRTRLEKVELETDYEATAVMGEH